MTEDSQQPTVITLVKGSQTDSQQDESASANAQGVAPELSVIEAALKDKQSRPPISPAQTIELLELIEDGCSVKEAAQRVSVNLRTAYRVLASYERDVDGVRNIMRHKALEALDAWQTAMHVGANKKGNHAAARDWLLHAGAIEPIAQDVRISGGIAICIGTPDNPMPIQPPQVVDGEVVTD